MRKKFWKVISTTLAVSMLVTSLGINTQASEVFVSQSESEAETQEVWMTEPQTVGEDETQPVEINTEANETTPSVSVVNGADTVETEPMMSNNTAQTYASSDTIEQSISKLTKVIEVAKQRSASKSKYTEESVAKFEATYQRAAAVLADTSASQQQVETQIRELTDDIYALTKTVSDKYRVKVACVGDSITYGAYAEASSYPIQLQKKFGINYEVRNFGLNGRTMVSKGDYPYMTEKAYTDSLDYQPDVVFIMLGTNDTKPKYQSYLSGFENDAITLIDSYKLLESQPIIYLNTSPTIFGNGLGTGDNAITEQVLVNTILPMQREIIQKTGVRSIDMHELTKNQASIFPDNVHGNEQGYGYLAEKTADEMKANQDIVRMDLNSCIDGKTGMAQTNFTYETWTAFTSALDAAKMVLANTDASIEEMNGAKTSLEAAFTALVYNNVPDTTKTRTKVACVGDSITYGGFAKELQSSLGSEYNVGNFGHNGRTVNNTIDLNGQPESYITCAEYQQSKDFEPDVVIIMLGTNDGKHMYWPKTVENSFAQNFKNNVKNLVSIYQSLPTKPVVFLASSPYARQNSDTSPGAIEDPRTWIHADFVNLDIVPLQRQVAKEIGVKFLDVNEYTQLNVPDSYVGDGIHGGYTQIASYVTGVLSRDAGIKKVELGRLVAKCKEISAEGYEMSGWNEFQTVLSATETELSKPMTFEQAEAFITDLGTARSKLKILVGPNVNMALADNGGKITDVSSELNHNYLAKYLIDGNENTSSGNLFWGTDSSGAEAAGRESEYVEITLDQPVQLNKAVIMEYYGSTWGLPVRYRVASFTIEAAATDDGEYTKVYEGTTIGNMLTVSIPEENIMEAKKVRLSFVPNTQGATEGMNFAEIKLFGLPVKTGELEITSILNLDQITADCGIGFEELNLPKTVKAMLSDGSEKSLNVTWEKGSYDSEKAGIYILNGTVQVEDGILNSKGLKASVKVELIQKKVDKIIAVVKNPASITVDWGTAYDKLELPSSVKVMLTDGTMHFLDVSWEKGEYNEKKAGDYTLQGSIILADEIQNPEKLISRLSIRVKEQVISESALKRQELLTLYNSCKDLKEADYTRESWETFQKCYDDAGKMLENTGLSDANQFSKMTEELRMVKDGLKKAQKPSVVTVKVTSITMKASYSKVAAGKKVSIKTTVRPSNAKNKALTWKSSNQKYATVNSKGVVTFKKAGAGKYVTITATAKDGSKVKKSLKFKIYKYAVKKITLKASSSTVKAGKSMTIKAVVSPSKEVNKAIVWKSSNTKYAVVNSKGKVTAKKAGKNKTVKITASATDGSLKKDVFLIKIK